MEISKFAEETVDFIVDDFSSECITINQLKEHRLFSIISVLDNHQKQKALQKLFKSIVHTEHALWDKEINKAEYSKLISLATAWLTILLDDDLGFDNTTLILLCKYFKNELYVFMGMPEKEIVFENYLPLNSVLKQFIYLHEQTGLNSDAKKLIKDMKTWSIFTKEDDKYLFIENKQPDTLYDLLEIVQQDSLANKNNYRLPLQDIGKKINLIIDTLELSVSATQREACETLIHQIVSMKNNKPTKKFTKATDKAIQVIGEDIYSDTVIDILTLAIEHPIKNYREYIIGDMDGWIKLDYLSSDTKHFIKGIIWSAQSITHPRLMNTLSKLLEVSYTKIPNVGAACATIGNAIINVLGNMSSVESLAILYKVKKDLKHESAIKMIDKQLDAGAKRLGVSVENLGEMAVPDFGFE